MDYYLKRSKEVSESATDRVKELQKALTLTLDEIKAAVDATEIKVEGSNVDVNEVQYNGVQKLQAKAESIKDLIIKHKYGEKTAAWLKEQEAVEGKVSVGQSVAQQVMAGQYGSKVQFTEPLGNMFVKSEVYKDFVKSGLSTMQEKFEIDLYDVTSYGTYGQKDVYNGMVSQETPHGFGRIQFDPMVPRAQRTNRVRDLFPSVTTTANLIEYFRVLGFAENDGTGSAAPVADRVGDAFGLKPRSNLRFEPDQAPVRTIAHWEAAHRNVIDDEPQVVAIVNQELLYGLALVEDDEILNGDGTGQHLLGVMQTPGIQTYTQGAELKSDALRRAATKVIIANYPATGYVLHPYDWEDIELQKGAGDGHYMLFSNISIGAAATVWRQPVVETPAMPEGTFMTGAWGLGATLYDRMLANVRISEHHEDFFVRNAVVILVEERLALAVKRPEAFVRGTFTT